MISVTPIAGADRFGQNVLHRAPVVLTFAPIVNGSIELIKDVTFFLQGEACKVLVKRRAARFARTKIHNAVVHHGRHGKHFCILVLEQQAADIIADRYREVAAVAVVIFVIHRIRVGNRHAVIKAPLVNAVVFMTVGGDVVFVEHDLVFGNRVRFRQIGDCNFGVVLILNLRLIVPRVQRIDAFAVVGGKRVHSVKRHFQRAAVFVVFRGADARKRIIRSGSVGIMPNIAPHIAPAHDTPFPFTAVEHLTGVGEVFCRVCRIVGKRNTQRGAPFAEVVIRVVRNAERGRPKVHHGGNLTGVKRVALGRVAF